MAQAVEDRDAGAGAQGEAGTSSVQAPPTDTWPTFATYLLRRYDRFVSEQAAAWGAIHEVWASLAVTHEPAGALVSARTLAEAATRFEQAGRRLLVEPYARCGHLRPMSRSLSAMEDLDREASTHAGAAEYLEGTRRATLLRARIDGAMQLLLCDACLRLGHSWHEYLDAELGLHKARKRGAPGASGGGPGGIDRAETQAQQILERYRGWTEDALIYLNLHRGRQRFREAVVRRHERDLSFWRGRQRAIAGVLDLETGIWRAGLECLRATDVLVERLKREGNDLRRQLRALVQYLNAWTKEPFNPPAADARILPPEARIQAWQSRMSAIVARECADRAAVLRPWSELPTALERSTETRPRSMYQRALHYEVLPVVDEQFRGRVAFHLEVAAALVRAQEVVRYALETSTGASSNVVAEARRNSLALLNEYDGSPEWDWEPTEASIARALLNCAGVVFDIARSGRAGFAKLLARRVRLQFTGAGRRSTIREAQSLIRPVAKALEQRSDALLVQVGWNEPERTFPPPVQVRSEIREFRDAGVTERSALYRKLFELSPVEDPRFLVGRDAEIEGFRLAYQAWRESRFAACLATGARGSGKSSLLCCALPQIVETEPVIRCEVDERLLTAEDLERCLRRTLNIPAGGELVESLRSRRQVIVLERLERAFLKTAGGFEAVRSLIELIHATASSVFWVVVVNARAFELLDAALNLGSFFSHRINAMGMPRDIIERAILERHYLSGLELSFPEVRRGALATALRSGDDPKTTFFAALHRKCGGNIRAALELWLSSIERAEDGAIRLKEPVAPDIDAFRQELGQADQFTLLALDQHGSLSACELATVLREHERASGVRLDRLARMGIVEQAGEESQIRIRLQAQSMVEELLTRTNLI